MSALSFATLLTFVWTICPIIPPCSHKVGQKLLFCLSLTEVIYTRSFRDVAHRSHIYHKEALGVPWEPIGEASWEFPGSQHVLEGQLQRAQRSAGFVWIHATNLPNQWTILQTGFSLCVPVFQNCSRSKLNILMSRYKSWSLALLISVAGKSRHRLTCMPDDVRSFVHENSLANINAMWGIRCWSMLTQPRTRIRTRHIIFIIMKNMWYWYSSTEQKRCVVLVKVCGRGATFLLESVLSGRLNKEKKWVW